MPSIAKMKSTKEKTPQTSDGIGQGGQQIAREADLLKVQSLGDRSALTSHRKNPRPPGSWGNRTSQTRAMAASSREAQDGMASALEDNNKDKTGRRTHAGAKPTNQEAKDTKTPAVMATEEENQSRMRTGFTVKSRKRPNDPEDEEGVTKKAGVGSPPNNGVGRRPANSVPRSILRAQKTPRTTPPAKTGTQKGATATPQSEGLRPRSSTRKGGQKRGPPP